MQMKLLHEKLSRLTEGEAMVTVPFPMAKRHGSDFGCDYVRMRMSDGSLRWLFINREGSSHEAKVIDYIYQGESLASQASECCHYIDHILQKKGRTPSKVNLLNLRTREVYINDYIAAGNSCVTAHVAYENHKTAWRRLIESYILGLLNPCLDKNSDELMPFLRVLARHSGKVFEPLKIARDCAATRKFNSPSKVVRAVEFLVEGGLWDFIPTSGIVCSGSRPASTKSIGYFFDSSFLIHLLWRRAIIHDDPILLETLFWHFVVNDLKRHMDFRHPDFTMTHFTRPPEKNPVIILQRAGKSFPLLVSFKVAGERPFRRLGCAPEASAKLIITGDEEIRKNASNRILLPFDLAIRE
jgi:hypothetical protein